MGFNEIMGWTCFVIGFWIAFEVWRAPMMDEETGRILKPAKTLKDLFKKKK